MKLFFDENISFRLPNSLQDIYPQSTHVRNVDLLGAEDTRICKFAKEQAYLLVSKDASLFPLQFA